MIDRNDRADYTALSDRMTYLLLLRVAMAAVIVAWSAARPEALGVSYMDVGRVSTAYLVIALVFEWARRRSDRMGFAVLSALLLLDGVYLAFGMYATGGTQSPIRFLAYLHVVAVSLLASYRTGLKIALWHSLLLFVVLYAQAAGLVPAVDVMPGRAIEFDRMPVLNVTSFWLFALATSIFSAMNERELRQRRSDLQALVDVGSRLDEVVDPVHQARIVLEGLAERFGVRRGVVLGVSGEELVVLAAIGTEVPETIPIGIDAVVRAAGERRDALPLRRLDPERNPVLAAALPDSRNLLVAPMLADGRMVGVVAVEHRSRAVLGVERRVLSVLRQFATVAALNLRNAVLLRDVQDLAQRDSLTGVANRRSFQHTLERILGARGDGGSVSAVLFLDLDDFKVVNDRLGHAAGDQLLVAVTARISRLVRGSDVVARLGGDEFAILTDDAPDLRRSRAIAERLVRDLREPYELNGSTLLVTASIGIAAARDATESAADLVRNADVAMYMAKANGKAGFAIFDPKMHAALLERHELGADLQRAAELEQLHLVYQPIVDLATGQLAGSEALLRWRHPRRGLVLPGDFIEIAEENGAILPIGRWVLRQACADATRWERAGLTRDSYFTAVNVSAREIQQPEYVAHVAEALAWSGLPAHRLLIEITETALLRATPTTIATLEGLRGLGVRVVIDDFGTGYFSLSHLRQFPVDVLKIASEFVQGGDTDARSAALAGAVVALGGSLGIEIVAEGIETQEQADRMRALGCTYGQGYHFSVPVVVTELERRLGEEKDAVRVQDRANGAPRTRQAPSASTSRRRRRLSVA